MKTCLKPRSALTTLALAFVLTASAVAWAQEGHASDIPRGTAWRDISSVRLDVKFPGDGYHAHWMLYRCTCGDLLVESELNLPGEVEKGELLLVGQRAVLERGFKSKELESQMSWDAPALMMQLAGYLMQRVVPEGPTAVTQRTVVSIEETSEGIALDSGNAVGGFPAPWAVTATVEPYRQTHRRFDLQFSFSVPGQAAQAEMRLRGEADYARQEFPLAEDMPIGDWHLSWRDEEDPAQSAGKAETLAELRSLISANATE